jgi:hypothetical protein
MCHFGETLFCECQGVSCLAHTLSELRYPFGIVVIKVAARCGPANKVISREQGSERRLMAPWCRKWAGSYVYGR